MEQSKINLIKNEFTNLAIELGEAEYARTEARERLDQAELKVAKVTKEICLLFNKLI